MSASISALGSTGFRGRLRWAAPAALLCAEYLALSLWVDFPTGGPAARLVAGVRALVPAIIGGGAAGWLVARSSVAAAPVEPAAEPSAWWSPWVAAVLHVVAFAATARLAVSMFGAGAPVGSGAFAAWLVLAAIAALLAVAIAVPAPALLRIARDHLRVPLFAAGVGLLSWRAVAAAEGLWGVLQDGTLHAVAAVLRLVARDVVVDPAAHVVGAGGFDVLVAPVCSGVDGLGLVVVFQGVWLAFARSRVRVGRALSLLLPLGAALALAVNVLRISTLIVLGASGRESLAMGAFHSKLGWMLFVAIALASVAAVEHVPWVRVARGGDDAARDGIPPAAAAYLAPLLAALAVGLATSLWAEPGLDRAYGLRVLAAGAVLVAVRRSLPAASVSFSSPVPLLLGAAVAIGWIAAPPGSGAPVAEALAALAPVERAAWIAARLVGSCLVLPIAEELAFRGFLLPWLVSPAIDDVPAGGWTWSAVLLSSLAFGAVHESWLLGTAAGVAFAAARSWRGRLSDAIVAHAFANACIAAAVLLGGRWELWS